MDCKICGYKGSQHGSCKTLEGVHIVCPGEYIIKGIKGEFYPCKPDIFKEMYEKVNNKIKREVVINNGYCRFELSIEVRKLFLKKLGNEILFSFNHLDWFRKKFFYSISFQTYFSSLKCVDFGWKNLEKNQ